jgi:hypothetical protein
MLEEAAQNGKEDLISWLPCGTKLMIRNQRDFAETIMSKYCRHSKYKSFLRQLSMYKFQRISSGPDKGAYHHPHFLRHRMDLADLINRENIQSVPASMLVPTGTPHAMDFIDPDVVSLESGFVNQIMTMAPENKFDPWEEKIHEIHVVGTHVPARVCPSPPPPSPSPSPSPIMTPDDIVDEIITTFRFAV